MTLNCEPLCQFTDRLFFTTFPCPAPRPSDLNCPGTSAPRLRLHARNTPPLEDRTATYYYFTVDDELTYLSFYEDWGPFNIAMIYRACIYFHEFLEDEGLKSHRLVLYSSSDPKRKANAALLMALYVLIVHRRPPWEAFRPIAELEFMPFRDAGRGRSDFNMSIHDCLWGFWKAQRNDLINMNNFSVEDYEYYEKVENGDWNWITPGFIAFASPTDSAWIRQQKIPSEASPSKLGASSFNRKLPQPYQNCLEYFEERSIKLVVRLNNPLYDKATFEERGMEHLELYFDDGTNPTDEIVREFISRSEAVHEAGGVVAVHCKAGLGRTGTLIGAYLIYKYDFTANEAIAFMRIARPGCVVGPQQQYLYQQQLTWARWAALDQARKEMQASAIATDVARVVTPPIEEKPLPTVPPANPGTPTRPSLVSMASTAEVEALLPPGQPRKTPTGKRIALEMLEDDEDQESDASDDSVLGQKAKYGTTARGNAPVTKQLRSVSPSGKTTIKTTTAVAGAPTRVSARTVPSTTSRVTRASTRMQNGASSPRKGSAPSSGAVTSRIIPISLGQRPPSRIREEPPPTRVRAGTQLAPQRQSRPTPSKIPARKITRAASPPPALPSTVRSIHPTAVSITGGSRLPTRTLVPSKRTFLGKPLPHTPQGQEGEDAWMSGVDAKAVVEPATKSGRPSIRTVRKRRSSFSSADIL